jgi:hypothetical protein
MPKEWHGIFKEFLCLYRSDHNKFSMKPLSFLFFCLSFLNSNSQPATLKWAKSMGGSQFEQARSMAVDASGNVYLAGSFSGTVDFDPGPGISNLTGYAPKLEDIFIAKLDSSGKLLWAKQFGEMSADIAYGLALDAHGNIYCTGYYQGTVDFDPSLTGISRLTSNGLEDIFILKLSTDGNYLWAKSFGSMQSDYGYSIATDSAGAIYATGYFNGNVNFDPGATNITLSSKGFADIFVMKLDASGDLRWAKAAGGASDDIAYSLTVDNAGSVFVTGSFRGTADFNTGGPAFPLSASANQDAFVMKMDTAGEFRWADDIGGDATCNARCVKTIGYGNIFVTGYFNGTADFNPSSAVFKMTSAGGADAFLLQLDASGNMVWASRIGGPLDDYGNSIAFDKLNNIYLSGSFEGNVDFDPSQNVNILTSAGKDDIFICKLNSFKDLLWAKRFGGISIEEEKAICIDNDTNLYITGSYRSTVDMDPSDKVSELTAVGMDDIFVLKIGQAKEVEK